MATISKEQFEDYMYNRKLPEIYREMDFKQVTQPLKRYLSSLIEGGYAPVLEDINNFLNTIDPEKCPDELFPLLCRCFGLTYFEDIDISYQRKFLQNIGEITKRRGTYSCVRYMVRVLTGLNVELEYKRVYNGEGNTEGRYLYMTLLAKSLEQLNNLDTSMSVVNRYIQSGLPYYITSTIASKVETQVLKNRGYMGGAITQVTIYDLVTNKK